MSDFFFELAEAAEGLWRETRLWAASSFLIWAIRAMPADSESLPAIRHLSNAATAIAEMD